MKRIVGALCAAVLLLGGCGSDDGVVRTDYTGVWSATWSFQVDLIATGTNYASNCSFAGSTTFEVWGENNFGPVNGTESMVCDNANNPGAQFEFGGTINGDTMAGRFYYWGENSITFAGKCATETSCQATGSNAFVITLTKM